MEIIKVNTKMDVQNVLDTPAFQDLNQSAITPPGSTGTTTPVDMGNVSIAEPESLAPLNGSVESGKGTLLNAMS